MAIDLDYDTYDDVCCLLRTASELEVSVMRINAATPVEAATVQLCVDESASV